MKKKAFAGCFHIIFLIAVLASGVLFIPWIAAQDKLDLVTDGQKLKV